MAAEGSSFPVRELVLASAGSGKTYQLSSRLIALLALEVPPQEILASTFTRKAAGEILERVLVRLARAVLDEREAEELRRAMPLAPLRESLTREECGRILVRSVDSLHRLQVHTLDAFFHKVARSFGLELGLPADWTVADEPTAERLRARALDETLRRGDFQVIAELVRLAGRGDADRSVHDLLLGQVLELHNLMREGIPDGPGFWGGDPAEGDEEGADGSVGELLEAFREVELPRTGSGNPRRHWTSNHEAIVAAVEEGDWDRVMRSTLVERVLEGAELFDRAEIPDRIRDLIRALAEAGADQRRRELRARIRALGRFLPAYGERLRRLQRVRGAFDFRDITYALVGAGNGPALDEVHYRLDGRVRHVLLDEFQDTSTAQWFALEPLVDEILSGHLGERAAFVVADPKQSIYGWRDGEPRILDLIRSRYGLEPSTLERSWRSSPVVLELVNRIFSNLPDNPVLSDDEGIREHAARWGETFLRHEAVHEDRPGRATVETGPPGEDGEQDEAVLRRAAERAAELHRHVPGATIGILTRKNRTVARLMAHLQQLGVEASEEGGVPVTDSAPVVAILALLRMADHPGDRISRYLVASTPLGEVVGLEDWRSLARAEAVARRVRARLLEEGYGPVLAGWIRALEGRVASRDGRRLRRLLELAYRWDEGPTLRPGDFVRLAESSRAEDPAVSAVRVMTVHRAKGLEFDVVILPELDESCYTRGSLPPFLAERTDRGAGRVVRILPGVPAGWEPLFPELEAAAAQRRESRIRDSLSALYVSVTRARFAVHAFMKPDPDGRSSARSNARLIREALVEGDGAAPPDTVLWAHGDPEWWKGDALPERIRGSDEGGAPSPTPAAMELRLAPSPRRRLLARSTPSELEGGEGMTLGEALRPRTAESLERGSLVHLWLQELEWLEEGWPDEGDLLALARERTPGVADPAALLGELREAVKAEEVRRLLSREAHPPGTTVDRELPFLTRDRDGLLQGVADRLLRIPGPDGPRLLVVDWKTDRIPAGDEGALAARTAHYRPQMEAYCRALASLEGVEEERVEGVLVFLEVGRAVPV